MVSSQVDGVSVGRPAIPVNDCTCNQSCWQGLYRICGVTAACHKPCFVFHQVANVVYTTCNSADVKDSIDAFVDLVERNPGYTVFFRLLTTSEIGCEKKLEWMETIYLASALGHPQLVLAVISGVSGRGGVQQI
jgi:hypothetical protein